MPYNEHDLDFDLFWPYLTFEWVLHPLIVFSSIEFGIYHVSYFLAKNWYTGCHESWPMVGHFGNDVTAVKTLRGGILIFIEMEYYNLVELKTAKSRNGLFFSGLS